MERKRRRRGSRSGSGRTVGVVIEAGLFGAALSMLK